jgi:hypothetical protein
MATTKEPEILLAVEVDASTGEINERPFTYDEVALHQAMQADAKARHAEQQAKETARKSALAKLADLGLTAEEIAAL